jgi:hypothetical protein
MDYKILNKTGQVTVGGRTVTFSASDSQININYFVNIDAIFDRTAKTMSLRNATELADVTGLDDIKTAITEALTALDTNLT